jgi:5-oxoprolinase (ATP-hydrolysing) subunit A
LRPAIDLNADLGEGFGQSRLVEDEALLDLVSSANIACGFHAGDATTMRDTVRAAAARGVAIGAHPSYPDIPGFGRRELDLPPKEIRFHVASQLRALRDVCAAESAKLSHVKPHGALYNRAAKDHAAADAVVSAILDVDASLVLLGLAGSEMARAAEKRVVAFAAEAFADRAYRRDGFLVPRSEPGAVIHDVRSAVDRAIMLVKANTIRAQDGATLSVTAQSLCVHGDNPDAAPMLRELRARLLEAGVSIAPFAA